MPVHPDPVRGVTLDAELGRRYDVPLPEVAPL